MAKAKELTRLKKAARSYLQVTGKLHDAALALAYGEGSARKRWLIWEQRFFESRKKLRAAIDSTGAEP